ncbi:MAG TPA: aminopeptidase [Gammaproteobacteria bacterium]|nr:aminopeptidase [Gammaproteobacteria bacterium]
MNKRSCYALVSVAVVALLAGCATRSISDAGPPGQNHSANPSYRGELTEFDVVGINPKHAITEADIGQALAASADIRLHRGSPVMVIQSGARIPDTEMLKALKQYFRVGAFSGIPPVPGIPADNYARALRLAAAKGGYGTIVVYWGTLESGIQNPQNKAISWIPLVGWSINDETELMRIQLKMALIDVRSGTWRLFIPPPFTASKKSDFFTRTSTDQSLVSQLKSKAYSVATQKLFEEFGDGEAGS